jgi:putative chitinase
LGLNPDGAFGPGTEKAVKEWQAKNGLTADGLVGEQTMAKMGLKLIKEDVVIPPSPFKLDNLRGHIPESVIAQIPDTAAKFNITTPLRLAHFLAQCAHESGNFKFITEFASGAAYEGRKDLGNTQPGDGVRFKGRGFIQLTGRANYTKFSTFCNEDCVANPELVANKYPMMSAAYFFNNNGLWAVCDKGDDDATVTAVTKRVNGGTNGLADRLKHFKEFWPLLK